MNFSKAKFIRIILFSLGFTLVAFATVLAGSPGLWQFSPEQKQQTQPILQDANKQIRQIKANNPHPSGAMQLRDQTKAIQSVRLAAIHEVLNTMPYQQQTTWNEFLAQGKENRKRLLQELDLSQQQRLKLAPILENVKAAAWEAAANPSLSIEDIQQQLRQQNQLAYSQMRAILKPSQQSKMDNWKQNHGKIFWLL